MDEQVKNTKQMKYRKSNVYTFTLDLNKNTESDLIEWLVSQPNRARYIKDLIRKDMIKKSSNSDTTEADE